MKKTLPELIAALDEALHTYDRLAFDEEMDHKLGKPCTPKEIATLEKKLGKALPPSYRAFLELHNGWTNFSPDAKLLSVEDQSSKWLKGRLADFEELYAEEDDLENPFEHGALPVLLGDDSNECLYLDPRTQRKDGEMDFVALDYVEEERRFKTFTAYLQHNLTLLQGMIEDEKKGKTEAEAEAEDEDAEE